MKKIAFIIFFFLFIQCQSLLAQQWHYYNPTLWFDVNAVAIPSPGVISVGGGWETNDSVQIMFQSSDYGLNWYENAHDGLAPWNKSIAFSDMNNGYGVGYDGRIIKSDDAGMNWGWPATPTSRDLNKIFYVANGTYYVVGGNKASDSIQTILKSIDYGNTWNVIYDTLGPWLKSLYFIDTLKGFAVGDNGVILSTTNGGNSWASVTAPIQRDFNGVTFINADTGYIVGGTLSGLCRRTILQTIDGGSNWIVLSDTSGGILNDISFADALAGYAVGDSATVLKTTDGGLNWLPILIDTNLIGNETFNAVKFYNQNFGVVGGKAGVLYVCVNPAMEAYTMGTEQIGTSTATLLGGINTNGKNAKYSFVYSSSSLFTSYDTTLSLNVQNDSLLMISESIQNLIPNTAYNFFLRACSTSDTVYGDTLSFYTGINPNFTFQTLEATEVGPWQAVLNGFVNKCKDTLDIFFEYGISPSFGSQIMANPSHIDDTVIHQIEANISGLQTDKQYFFRLKGVSDSGIYYGDIKTFFTFALIPVLKILPASGITLNSASLNGQVSHAQMPLYLSFEYGLDQLLGSQISATPSTISDSLTHEIIANISGLLPNTFYYYRLKGTTPDNFNVFSEIHKLYTAECEVPNCSFELWDSLQSDKPYFWYVVGLDKKVPSYNGTNAVKIGGGTSLGAFFSSDNPKNGEGGIPFNARPDSIVCHIKYDIVSGDTAYIFAFFKKNESYIYQLFAPVTGSSGGNFKRFSYPLSFPDINVPDSLIIGAISSNAFWAQSNPASWLIIDDISFIGQGSGILIPNSDFEEWALVNYQLPKFWFTNTDNIIQVPDLVAQSSDKVWGNYAVQLENKPSQTNKPAVILVGDRYSYNNPTFALNVRHETFNFYAKYLPQNQDTLGISLNLYSNGAKIGFAGCFIDSAVTSYSPFNVNIQYIDPIAIPDSAELSISVGITNAQGNSKAWIDNLSFDGFSQIDSIPSSISEMFSNMLLNVYPNPANDKVNIEYYNHSIDKISILVYDINGRLLFYSTEDIKNQGTIIRQVDISRYPSGMYLISVVSSKAKSTRKLIIQK